MEKASDDNHLVGRAGRHGTASGRGRESLPRPHARLECSLAPGARGRRSGGVMETDPLQPGDLVQILATAEPPPGQVTPPPRWGYVTAPADDNGRVAVRVEGRQYPRLVPEQQLR